MTNDQIKQIIDDANKANQRIWEYNKTNDAVEVGSYDDDYSFIALNLSPEDGSHIANTCPANIIPLLEELLEFRGKKFDLDMDLAKIKKITIESSNQLTKIFREFNNDNQ